MRFNFPRVIAAAIAGLLAVATVAAAAATLSVEVVDAGGTPLRDAAVHVDPVGAKAPARASTAVIDQVDREFTPLVSVIQTGTVVRFPNKDNIRHSVYSFSPAKRFELKLYSGEKADPIVFDKAGLVVLGCNIHDKMVAYVLVVDSPWAATTDGQGVARVSGVPPGDYDVVVWHPRLKDEAASVHQTVKVAGDQVVRVVVGTPAT